MMLCLIRGYQHSSCHVRHQNIVVVIVIFTSSLSNYHYHRRYYIVVKMMLTPFESAAGRAPV